MVAILGILPVAAGVDCSFRKDPEEFLARESRAYRALHARVSQYKVPFATARKAAEAIDSRNFIDDAIFGKLRAAGVASAALSTDEEFYRRVSFDMIGRLPNPAESPRLPRRSIAPQARRTR